MNCIYTESEKVAPQPRTRWEAGCGLDYVLMEGFNPDWNSNDYGKPLKPTGNCMKCKKPIITKGDR